MGRAGRTIRNRLAAAPKLYRQFVQKTDWHYAATGVVSSWRHRSGVLAPAPACFSTPMICSSANSFLIALTAFPKGSLWRERPPKGECLSCATVCAGERSPVPHQRQQTGGRSLHFLPSRAARHRAGRGGDTRGRRLASLCRRGCGESMLTLIRHGFPGKDSTTAARARPLREKRCGCQKRAPPR